MTRHPGVRLNEILAGIPALRDRLRDAPLTTTERGSLTLTRRLHRVTRNNIALIGDASGSVDAITGEGLALGFRQALLLADSLATSSLALYESHHAAILTLPQRMATLLLLLDRHPRLRNRALQAFAARPALFRELLAVHVGEKSFPAFLFRHGATLGTLLIAHPEATET
jgi:flavin-dependent dehydrogenase